MDRVPVSFEPLHTFLTRKKRSLSLYVNETNEMKADLPGGGVADSGEVEEPQVRGEECDMADSEDEEVFEDAPENRNDDE